MIECLVEAAASAGEVAEGSELGGLQDAEGQGSFDINSARSPFEQLRDGDIKNMSSMDEGLKKPSTNDTYDINSARSPFEQLRDENESGLGQVEKHNDQSERTIIDSYDGRFGRFEIYDDQSSVVHLDENYVWPNGNSYHNPDGKTIGELAKDLGTDNLTVRYNPEGEPIFDCDPGTETGRPYEVTFSDGIGSYLDDKGGQIDRKGLHEEAFNKLADQLNCSVDEIRVFKGDADPIQRLQDKWNCSEDEVWQRCNNPNHVNRTWHECRDQKTVQLVPNMFHNISHDGGVSEFKKFKG